MARAVAAGADALAIFTAATDAFTQHNIGMTIDESLAAAGPVLDEAAAARLVAAGLRLDRLRLPVHGQGRAGCRDRRRPAPGGARRRRDLLRRHDRRGRPRPGRGADGTGDRGRPAARADRVPLPRHARDGPGQRGGRPAGGDSDASTPRPAGPAAAPTRRAPRATSRPRTWSTSSTRRAGATAFGWPGSSRPPRFISGVLGRPLGSKVGQAGGWDPATGAASPRP